jgi:hypothetical protein
MNCETCQLKELVRFRSNPLPWFHYGFIVADFDEFVFFFAG